MTDETKKRIDEILTILQAHSLRSNRSLVEERDIALNAIVEAVEEK